MLRVVEQPCLFCRKEARESTSESHIIPQALGNNAELQGDKVLVLPPGFVCDSCNKWFGAKVEASVLQDDFGVWARFRGVKSQQGKYPTFKPGVRTTVSRDGGRPEEIDLLRISPTEPHRLSSAAPSESREQVRLNYKIELRPKPHYTSALLSKMLIEYIAHIYGRDAALHKSLDRHRLNARRPKPTIWLPYYYGPGAGQIQLHLDLLEGTLLFAFDVAELVLPIWLHDPKALPVVEPFVLQSPAR